MPVSGMVTGGVMTPNLGPLGETYQYFYTCGPVLDNVTPDYYKDTSYPNDLCVMAGQVEYGPLWEQKVAIGLCWFTIVSSLVLFLYYLYETFKGTCGWEEMYVVCAETLKICIEMKLEWDSPAMLYQVNGTVAPWIRYAEWLLTCPVILIHLSNLTGLKGEYNKRTMFLLVSDLGTIVWGVTAANAAGSSKVIFFIVGVCYSCNTFFHASKVYIESYHMVPKGICKRVVTILAWMFFCSWMGFPLAFIAGPEGTKSLTYAGSTIAHTICDLLSKNLWGFIANYLRRCIHKHIIIHGDIRKVNIAGESMEIEEYVTEEDEETIKHPTEALGKRADFLRMRDNLNKRGQATRASLEFSGQSEYAMHMTGVGPLGGKGMAGPPIHNGRVILGVVDPSHTAAFAQAFSQLPAQIEVVPCLGPQNVMAMCQQASVNGGFDFVLLHPEYLRDRSGSGLLVALKQNGVKIASYGWEPTGFVHEVIVGAQVDGYIMGPNQQGLDTQALLLLVARMQGTLNQFQVDYNQMAGLNTMGGGGIPAGMGSTSMQQDHAQGWYGGMGQTMGHTMGSM